MRTSLRKARGRAVVLLAFASLLAGLAELRLLDLQVLGARSPERSSIYRTFPLREEGRRGELRDARGGVLATSVREVDVRVWTPGIAAGPRRDDRAALAARLAELCGAEPERTLERLSRPRAWTLLATGIRDPGMIAGLRALAQEPRFRALSLETRFVREYPRGATLAPLLGWVGWPEESPAPDDRLARADDAIHGVAGLEARCEELLAPRPGRRLVHRDGRQRDMLDPSLPSAPASDGRTVDLTIEPVAQALAEEAIDSAVAEFQPDWAQIVVLDPATAEVKALSQRPAPRSPRPAVPPDGDVAAELAKHECLALQRAYPPGSSFKPLMLGLVLDRGLATPETQVDCENGAAAFGRGRVIHDSHPKPVLTVSDVLVESSNIGMAKLVLQLVPSDARKGDPAFRPVLDHIRRLGFSAPAYGFAGETGALLPSLRSMTRNYTLASLAFGQELGVTALQMAAACAATANGGTWRPARLVQSVSGDDGAMLTLPAPGGAGRQVFTPVTASNLRAMLVRVVEEGATRRWKPRGWSVGGKTGTAEDESRGKVPVASYWCFGPAHDARFLVLVVLYHPRHGRFAAENAARVGGPLLGRLLERFEVPRDRPEELLGGPGSPVVASRPVGEDG